MQDISAFEKWVVDFIGSIHPLAHYLHVQYIIIATYYLTCLAEAILVKDFTTDMVTLFIFENHIHMY